MKKLKLFFIVFICQIYYCHLSIGQYNLVNNLGFKTGITGNTICFSEQNVDNWGISTYNNDKGNGTHPIWDPLNSTYFNNTYKSYDHAGCYIDSVKDSTKYKNKFHIGLSATMEVLPKLNDVTFQNFSIGYGAGLSLSYNFKKKHLLTADFSFAKAKRYFESKEFYKDSLNQIIEGVRKSTSLTNLFIPSMSFKYALYEKNKSVFFIGCGIRSSTFLIKSEDVFFIFPSFNYSYSDTYNPSIGKLFQYFIKRENSSLNIALSSTMNYTVYKNILLFSEFNVIYNDKYQYYFLSKTSKRLSYSLKIGVEL